MSVRIGRNSVSPAPAADPAAPTNTTMSKARHDSHSGVQYLESPMPAWRQILSLWKSWVIIFTPIVLLPIALIYNNPAGKCAYAVLIMAAYWCTEAIPIAATALLPFVLMPWLGVVSAKDIAVNYLKDTNFLFFGGLLVAVAIEKCNLHKRMALRVLLIVGSKPIWLMFGFMLTTAFLSMWLSNTATTAMMVPIVNAVLMELREHKAPPEEEENKSPDEEAEAGNMTTNFAPNASDTSGKIYPMLPEDQPQKTSYGTVSDPNMKTSSREPAEDKAYKNQCIGMMLAICYAANIGGTATLTGTGPNLVMKGQADTIYGSEHGLNFTSWFIFAFPLMVLCLILAWIRLVFSYLGPKTFLSCCGKRDSSAKDDGAAQVIRREYDKLGPMRFAEIATLIHFIVLALLWLTREPEFMPGWGILFKDGYVTDACVGVTVAVVLFAFPAERPNILCCRKSNARSKPGPVPSLLDWETVHSKMAWSVIIVLGGGFALADATKAIGDSFVGFDNLPVWVLVLILSFITAGITEVTSNSATATIFLPILAELAESIGVNPFYLMIPCAISASFAFMLPVATPPNAIVFAFGHMKIIDMVKCGLLMNILCILVLTLAINTWGYAFFGLGTVPDWALDVSVQTTQVVNTTLPNCIT